MIKKADGFNPDLSAYKNVLFEYKMYESIWSEAERMRSNGDLLLHANRISCPVLAIHGENDPHPYQGVKLPLQKVIKDFRFKLLSKCGHEPWSENLARDIFLGILEKEI